MKEKKEGLFGSKEYHFLRWLQAQEQSCSQGMAIILSQEQIAIRYGVSPTTANKWLRALQRSGCVEQKKKGCYMLTPTGHSVILKMQEVEALVHKGAK